MGPVAGRIILGILLALLLLLVVVLLIPARVRFSYDRGEAALWIRFGPLKLQIFPKREAAEAEIQEKKPKRSEEHTSELQSPS